MKKIKSFIYLDSNKMYSISSQLFEGLTEYIVNSERKTEVESTKQKGTIGSGRLMADIMESNLSKSEKKFLHDYSYILFEDALIKENKVLIVDETNLNDGISKIDDFNFIKVTNNVIFNDTKMIEKTMSEYNTFGQALTYITEQDRIKQIKELAGSIKDIKDRNQQSKAKQILNGGTALKNLAKAKGLYLDDEYIKHLTYTLSYGYHGQFEIQVPFKTDTIDKLFSAILKRELLLENEINIIKKYSRKTEKAFTVFGILTQTGSNKEKKEDIPKDDNEEPVGMKRAILNIIDPLSDVEDLFIGKLGNEYILDPIAVYREI